MGIFETWDMAYLYTILVKYKDLRADLCTSRVGVLNDEFYCVCDWQRHPNFKGISENALYKLPIG